MRIMILGSGYVGLVSGICFAEFGFNVISVDNSAEKIAKLQKGILPIYEPGLEDLLRKNLAEQRISFTTDLYSSVASADIIFLAVGTPSLDDGGVDLTYILQAVKELAPALDNYTPVVIKSTVPPGTCRKVKQEILNVNPQAKFDVISNPEFLREGVAVRDFMQPDRIVIGIDNEANRDIMAKIYRPFQAQRTPIVYTTLETSELIKYASNAFLATKITFINEMADVCEKINADVQVLAQAIGMDQRIGPHFLQTGPGFGGSCFPKDTLAVQNFAAHVAAPSQIISAVINANNQRKHACVERIIAACNGSVQDKEIAVLGVAFKANTDDIRESPALDIIDGLVAAGARIRLFDPAAITNAQAYFNKADIRYPQTIKECICNAHALVLLTEWQEFKTLNLPEVASLLCAYDQHTPKAIIDLRNLYEPTEFIGLNVKYVSLGRPILQPSSAKAYVGINE